MQASNTLSRLALSLLLMISMIMMMKKRTIMMSYENYEFM